MPRCSSASSSVDEDEFLNALDEALAAGLVVEAPAQPGRYSFSHALIRETLYEGMSAPRRARTHRRVGEALEAAGLPSGILTALALHFTRAASAQDAEKAIEYATARGRAGDHDARPRGGRRALHDGRSRCSSGSTPTPTRAAASC